MAMFTNKLMVAFFTTSAGAPATGLSAVVDIWEVNGGTQVVTAGAMTEIGGGFYKYDFTSYDYTKLYGVRYDGGSTLGSRRYAVAFNSSFYQDVAYGNWEEIATDHAATGTLGLLQNQIAADTSATSINVGTLLSVAQTMMKYHTNKTKIDFTNFTLTVYDNDGTTPLQTFDLKDRLGAPSTTDIAERIPH